jgi:putative spermidine/putrescine transport system ATP-binding protein
MLQVEFKRIHRELGITFVYVTHDQEEAIVLSDRIAVFNEGKIEQVGTPHELYESPATLFVARFLGESNLLTGHAHGTDAGSIVVEGGATLRGPSTGKVQAGQPCVLVLRPEHLRLGPAGSPQSSTENAVSASVTRVDYLGSNRRVEVQLASGQICSIREQSGSGSDAREGDNVVVSWSHDAGVVLPTDATELVPEPDLAGAAQGLEP